MTDQEFAASVAERSARIPGVVAVTLGGSRAQGDHGPDSDWDFGLYYRGRLDPEDVAALGWPGRVFAPGERGGGVIIGGAWLQVDGRQVDLHYRDLDDVEHWLAEARRGRFKVERLPFYLAGIPTYVVVGELAVAQVLVGELPRPGFPVALRQAASSFWQAAAELSLDYADSVYARRGDALGCAGWLARAVIEAAHARLAAKGAWVLNENASSSEPALTTSPPTSPTSAARPANCSRPSRSSPRRSPVPALDGYHGGMSPPPTRLLPMVGDPRSEKGCNPPHRTDPSPCCASESCSPPAAEGLRSQATRV